jgi:hypothetical protein
VRQEEAGAGHGRQAPKNLEEVVSRSAHADGQDLTALSMMPRSSGSERSPARRHAPGAYARPPVDADRLLATSTWLGDSFRRTVDDGTPVRRGVVQIVAARTSRLIDTRQRCGNQTARTSAVQ